MLKHGINHAIISTITHKKPLQFSNITYYDRLIFFSYNNIPLEVHYSSYKVIKYSYLREQINAYMCRQFKLANYINDIHS